MKFKTLLLIPLLLSAACATDPSNTPEKADKLTVPVVKEYTSAQQKQAADEMERYCSKVPMLCQMIDDFGRMRDSARVALGLNVDVNRGQDAR